MSPTHTRRRGRLYRYYVSQAVLQGRREGDTAAVGTDRDDQVRARSALNHVPGDAYGFSWTINPYRGCTHACVFCLDGATPILLADGR